MATATTRQNNEPTENELRARIEALETELAQLRRQLRDVQRRQSYQAKSGDPRQQRPI